MRKWVPCLSPSWTSCKEKAKGESTTVARFCQERVPLLLSSCRKGFGFLVVVKWDGLDKRLRNWRILGE